MEAIGHRLTNALITSSPDPRRRIPSLLGRSKPLCNPKSPSPILQWGFSSDSHTRRSSAVRMSAAAGGEGDEANQAKEMAAARRRWESLIRDQKVKALTPKEAGYAIQLSNKTLLDVRPSTEHNKAWVRDSTWIPIFDVENAAGIGTLSKRVTNFVMGGWWSGIPMLAYDRSFVVKVEEMFPKDTDLIIVCQKGLRHQTVDVSRSMLSLANDVTCRIVFGKKCDGDRSGFGKILAETQNLAGGFCIEDYFPWLGWVSTITGLRARLENNTKELDGIFDKVIEEHLRDQPEAEHEDFVHVLLRLHKDPKHGATFSSLKHVKGIIMDMFVAGTDTSSATLVWAMTELMRNPRAMNKLRREVGEAVAANDGKLEETAVQRVDYLKQVLKEVLRLHPPVPLLIPRETTESCRIDEYEIPGGTRVIINAKVIAMDPECWVNPEEFRPERFSGEDIDYACPGLEMVPFGVGRRNCPGARMAMALVELALATLVYNFEWEMPDGMEPDDLDFDELPGVTIQKKIPLRLVAKPISL